jgi:hypothetical protein
MRYARLYPNKTMLFTLWVSVLDLCIYDMEIIHSRYFFFIFREKSLEINESDSVYVVRNIKSYSSNLRVSVTQSLREYCLKSFSVTFSTRKFD